VIFVHSFDNAVRHNLVIRPRPCKPPGKASIEAMTYCRVATEWPWSDEGKLHHNLDAPGFDVPEDFREKAKPASPRNKESVHLRLDPDVLEWFRRQGPGYQTRINAVLRSYFEAHKNEGSG